MKSIEALEVIKTDVCKEEITELTEFGKECKDKGT